MVIFLRLFCAVTSLRSHASAMALVTCLIAACSIGCGGTQSALSGIVTLDGIPLEKAIVHFVPESEHEHPAVVLTDSQGRYRTRVAPVTYRVAIQCQKVVGKMEDEFNRDGPPIDRYEDVIPIRYANRDTTPLRATPTAGQTSVANFALTSRK